MTAKNTVRNVLYSHIMAHGHGHGHLGHGLDTAKIQDYWTELFGSIVNRE